jgi:uncharacterized protein (TIGR02996 family)
MMNKAVSSTSARKWKERGGVKRTPWVKNRMVAVTQNEAFLQAIMEKPDDDSVRLVFADWLEEHDQPERAEFIRLQCRMADPSLKGPRRWRLRAQIHRLLTKHEPTFVGPLAELVRGWEFRRGFVEFVVMEASKFLSYAELLFQKQPVRHVQLVDYPEMMAELAASPWLGRPATLQFNHINYQELRCLLTSPQLAQLRELILCNGSVDNPGAQALAECPHIAQLSRLDLSGNGIRDEGFSAILRSPKLTKLTALNLSGNRLTLSGIRMLMDNAEALRIREFFLDFIEFGVEGVQLLVASPHLAYLEVLSLRSCQIGEGGAQALAAAPGLRRLRYLDLWNNQISQAGREALVSRFGKGVCRF